MIELIKKNLKIIEILNEASQKSAVPSDEIAEFKDRLVTFQQIWKNFELFLNTKVQALDPNDIEEVKDIIRESWRCWDEAERILYDFDELIHKLSTHYIPPDPEAALEYTTMAAQTPLELARREAEMEPLEHLKVREETFNFTSMIAFVQVSQGFLINHNDLELITVNHDLTVHNKIALLRPFDFDYWDIYKKFDTDEVIFYSAQQNDLLYVNAATLTYTFIENKEFPELWPRRIYYWRDRDLIVQDTINFYRVNPYENVIEQLDTAYIKAIPDFYEYYQDSRKYDVVRVYAQDYSFTYRDLKHQEVGLRNSKQRTTKKIRFYNERVHDIKVYKDYFMFIEQDTIEIRKARKRTQILPNPRHTFLAAEFFENNGKLYVMCVAKHRGAGLSSSVMLYRIADTFDELILDDPKR